jgi:hypothetical protein
VRKDVTPPTAENNDFFMVPFVRSSDHLRVRKIQFSAATSWDDAARDANGEQIEWEGRRARKHMAPDPLLLLARAALVFSSRHGNRFATGAEEPPEDDDWRHQYEEERFVDYLQSTLRPPDDPIELARALGQSPEQ